MLNADQKQDGIDMALARIYAETGTSTQVGLAEVLQIRQSSISDAKRRASIPDGWLVKLIELYNLNPDWIRTGMGPKYLLPSDDEQKLALQSMREKLRQEVLEDIMSDPQSVTYETACKLLLTHFPAGTTIQALTPDIKG